MNVFTQLLFNPAILSLFGGGIIGLCTRWTLSSRLMDYISIYLIFTIGFKGGACFGSANQCTPALLTLALIGAIIGFIQPFIHYIILNKTTQLDKPTAAVVASEYGSISIVTFITAITFLNERNVPYDTFMSAIAGMMEIPAIFSGLFLIKHEEVDGDKHFFASLFTICKAILMCKKISFIFIGFAVGFLLRNYQTDLIDMMIIGPFTFMLVLFMLDIGIKIAKEKSHIRQFSSSIVAFAIYMPIINGIIGLVIAQKFVIFPGSAILFALLLASASYIAVPAIMGTQTNDAKEAIYLPMSLGITLPFNLLIGLPIYYYLQQVF